MVKQSEYWLELLDSEIEDITERPTFRESRPRLKAARRRARSRERGSALFGNAQQPSSSGGIFGTAATTSFGQQPKSTGFGFPSSSSGGLFGQNAQPQQNTSSMFQPSSSSALFGSSSSFGTDSVQKSGVVQSINTKHHCITCMKEYENKSLEELRWEDYQANRKGPQQTPSFGVPSQPFGIASTNSSLFGQTENKPVFGQSSGTFAQPNFGISSQTTPSNIFGKPSTGFGNTSTTNSFAFAAGTPTAGPFGSSIATKPFAAPTNQPLFGQTQPQQSTFGTNTFGQPSTQPSTSNLFAKPQQQQGFNMGQSTFQFGSQPQNSTNVFQTPKSNTTGFNIFGQSNTTTPSFGQPQQQQSTFTPFNNFGKPAQPTFAQPSQSIFGTDTNLVFQGLNSSSIFGNNANKTLFTPTTNLFGNTFQPTIGFTMPSQQPQQQPILNIQPGIETQLQDSRPFLQIADPYGYHPHLDGLSPVKQPVSTYTTNPVELKKYLEIPQPIAIVSPTQKRLKVFPPLTKKKGNLFDDELDNRAAEINFSMKRSAKRLIICKNPDERIKPIEFEGDATLRNSAGGSSDRVVPPSFTRIRTASFTDDDSPPPGLSRKYDKPVMVDKESQVNGLAEKPAKCDISTETRDTCGIILKRPEYYTVPPVEKLHEHRQADGQCWIKGFTIGRIGYGNVSFPDLMDVSNLNIDDLVHFRYRELTIYPDDEKRPPLGQGLNRRAQVTLDRVYPKTKIGRKIITDVKVLIAINFSESLRNLCDKHGTKFLDYRPETGSWVFMVEHFSKYTFTDSDEEETLVIQADLEVDTSALVTQPQAIAHIVFEAEPSTSKKRREITDDEKKVIEQSLQELMEDDDDIMIDVSAIPTDTPMTDIIHISDNVSIDDDNEEMEYHPPVVAVRSSEDVHQVKSRIDLYQRKQDERVYGMKAALFEDDDYIPVSIERDNIETLSKGRRIVRAIPPITSLQSEIEKNDLQQTLVFNLMNKPCVVPLNRSYHNSRNYMDMGIFKGRSFRVGWSRGLILVAKPNALKKTRTDRHIRSNKLEIIDVTNLTNYDPLLESLPGHLHIIMESSEYHQVDGVPFFTVKQNNESLKRHKELAREMYLKHYDNRDVSYFYEVWDLIVALWDDIAEDETRHEYLSEWFKSSLERITMKTANKHTRFGGDFFKAIFALLTGYQIHDAAEIAIRNGLPNLALLITQRSLNTRYLLQYQVEQWRMSLSLDFIDAITQKIYLLLCGLLVYQYDSNRSTIFVNVFDKLNWKQSLAIILWYILLPSDSISTAVYYYQQAFGREGVAKSPTAEHVDDGASIMDFQYYLLMLYCNMCSSLDEILYPLTTTSYAADYRLSWIFLQILTSLQVGKINEPARNIITTSFSAQLESFGLTKWAVFVLLFIKDSSVRKNLVMTCLHRNLAANPSVQIENELVTDLHIPADWIHEIEAYRHHLLGMHWQSYRYFAYTKLWYESHKVVMETIVPDLIVNEKFDVIRKILETLQQGRRRISTWKNQGGALLDFIKIMEIFNENNQEFNKDDALAIHSALLEVCLRFQYYPQETPKQMAAISELSKRCFIYIDILMEIISPSYQGIIMTTQLQVSRLVMPPDYLLSLLKFENLFDF